MSFFGGSMPHKYKIGTCCLGVFLGKFDGCKWSITCRSCEFNTLRKKTAQKKKEGVSVAFAK